MTETKTTKTTKATASKAAEKTAAEKTADDSTFADRLSMGACDFVKRTTATAKERTDGLYDNSKRYGADLESMLVRAARGYVDVLSNIADAAYANANHTYATAEKLADAKSVSETIQIQADFVRERSSKTAEDLRSAFEYTRDVVTTNTEALRDNAKQMWKSGQEQSKAA